MQNHMLIYIYTYTHTLTHTHAHTGSFFKHFHKEKCKKLGIDSKKCQCRLKRPANVEHMSMSMVPPNVDPILSTSVYTLTFASKQNHVVRKVHDEWNVGSVYAHLGEYSIKFKTKYIRALESIPVPFFVEGVLYIKRTSHVSISVSMRMTIER